MQPKRRFEFELDDQGAADHEEAGDQDDDPRGAVARTGEGIIEPADLATRPQRQEALKQPAPAAAGAAASEPAADRREFGIVSHLIFITQKGRLVAAPCN